MTDTPRITLKEIARALGVSSATVSLALRNDPRIATKTRDRVHETALRMGYRPDPHLSQLMGYLRTARAHLTGTTIALVSDWTAAEMRENRYMQPLLEGAESKAAQLGYRTEIFTTSSKLSYKRIESILRARGIQGLVILPHRQSTFSIDDFDFTGFASAATGYGMSAPELHRSASQQTRAAMQVVDNVIARGYRRVGLVLDRNANARTAHRHLSGFLGQMAAAGMPIDIPPLILESIQPEPIRDWLWRFRPEAVVTSSVSPEFLLAGTGIEWGDHIGIAMVNHSGEPKVAHLQTPYREIGQAAVSLVHTQLCSHESGIPQVPQVLSVPGKWYPGASLRPRENLVPWPEELRQETGKTRNGVAAEA